MNQLEFKIKNIHKLASKKPISCLATCESLASKIFVETGKRPDLFRVGNYHYHLRINNLDIVDPTLSQFFQVPGDYRPKVFIGSLPELKLRLSELEQEYGFNENHLYIKTNQPRSVEDLFHLWSCAQLNKSGARLRKMVIPPSGKEKAWYE
ncbi:hypothetical protein [Kaarinaea lacus]